MFCSLILYMIFFIFGSLLKHASSYLYLQTLNYGQVLLYLVSIWKMFPRGHTVVSEQLFATSGCSRRCSTGHRAPPARCCACKYAFLLWQRAPSAWMLFSKPFCSEESVPPAKGEKGQTWFTSYNLSFFKGNQQPQA